VFAFYLAVICFISAAASVLTRAENYLNGREVIFDDRLTIHYPWPLKTCVYEWSEVARIEKIDEKVVVRESELWVPVPIGGIVPGLEIMLQIDIYHERLQSVRTFRIVHSDGRQLSDISGDNFKIGRWLGRKTIDDIVTMLGGEIVWNGDSPQRLSLRDSRISTPEWLCLREHVANISGLQEIDLSGTALSDEALQGLEQFPALQRVQTRGSQISPAAIAQLTKSLADRNSRKPFDFLAG
jgi:hypothetical protein